MARAAALATFVAAAATARLSAQQVQIILPPTDPFPAAPPIFVSATGFAPERGPYTLSLEIANNRQFTTPLFAEFKPGDAATFTPIRLLPQTTTLYFRVRVLDRFGVAGADTVLGPRTTGRWITPIAPGGLNVVLHTVHPTFVWSESFIQAPGPWVVDLSVINTHTGIIEFFQEVVADTSVTLPDTVSLHVNTSYRWQLFARPQRGDSRDTITVTGPSTFTIASDKVPLVTLLYQNFPNPFPTPASQTTCIWFDLSTASTVSVRVYSLRGDLVRTLVPGVLESSLAAGQYGRGTEAAGCDEKLVWDGRGDDGRIVPPGIYLLRFQANGVQQYKKMLFRGR